jgi:hypothetical protein
MPPRWTGDPPQPKLGEAMRVSFKRRHMAIRPGVVALIATAVSILVAPVRAQAAPVTVGSPLTTTFAPVEMCSPVCTAAPVSLPEAGAHASSPISGTVVRWHVLDASGGALRVRVLHPVGGEKYEGSTPSSFETPAGSGLQTFAASLPIQVGDLIALENSSASVEIGVAPISGSETGAFIPPLPETGSEPFELVVPVEIAFNAEVQLPPGITGVSSRTGSIKGGTSTVISGHDFTGARVRSGSALSQPRASW